MNKRDRVRPGNRRKLKKLEDILRRMGKVLVAFRAASTAPCSEGGGRVLGENVLAVIASSETYPGTGNPGGRAMAGRLEVRHRVIHTCELENPEFVKNPPLRCYYCKQELFSSLKRIAKEEGIPHVLDGQNADDTADFRPGRPGREGARHSIAAQGSRTDQR